MTTCTRNNLDKLFSSQEIEPISNFLNYCEAECQHWSYCRSYSLLDQKLSVLNGQATECKCCGEIYDHSEMDENGYCERCQRAERSRC